MQILAAIILLFGIPEGALEVFRVSPHSVHPRFTDDKYVPTWLVVTSGTKHSASMSYSTLTVSAPSSELASRIVNGYEIDISEIPYQAALIGYDGVYYCGAVIIHEKAVLTAAHCVYKKQRQSHLRISVGKSYRLFGRKSYDVIQVFLHMFSPSEHANDIAMLITSPMQLDRNVKPIRFATPGFRVPDGAEAIVSGYGDTSFNGPQSEYLRAAKVKIISRFNCFRAYFWKTSIYSSMICAAASNPARDSCQGDSGGPLVANGTLIGLVSFGYGCADPYYPGVYTRVSKYSEWIQSLLTKIDEGVLG